MSLLKALRSQHLANYLVPANLVVLPRPIAVAIKHPEFITTIDASQLVSRLVNDALEHQGDLSVVSDLLTELQAHPVVTPAHARFLVYTRLPDALQALCPYLGTVGMAMLVTSGTRGDLPTEMIAESMSGALTPHHDPANDPPYDYSPVSSLGYVGLYRETPATPLLVGPVIGCRVVYTEAGHPLQLMINGRQQQAMCSMTLDGILTDLMLNPENDEESRLLLAQRVDGFSSAMTVTAQVAVSRHLRGLTSVRLPNRHDRRQLKAEGVNRLVQWYELPDDAPGPIGG